MKPLVAVVLIGLIGFCNADAPPPTPQPYVGEWNYTYPHGSNLCMRLKAGIRLDIHYTTTNKTQATATINSTEHVIVSSDSKCANASTDVNETLVLNFAENSTLSLFFTRDHRITKDDSENRWELYSVEYDFVYDSVTFPNSEKAGESDKLGNTNSTIAGIATGKDRSFTCSKTGAITIVPDRFTITFTSLRVQAYMTGNEFSSPDRCANDQETTDLIPIIIGAALAALVIIVLVAYLIGRARANTPAYDNMK